MSKIGNNMRTFDELQIVEYDRTTDLTKLGEIWNGLLELCEHDYFLSWGWISTWLKSLPRSVDVRLVVGYLEEQPALAFFIGSASRRRFGILSSRRISLNTTGNRVLDQLYIEYNAVLCIPSLRFDLGAQVDWLEKKNWHEFLLPGLSATFIQQTGLLNHREVRDCGVMLTEQTPAFFVDLQKVRGVQMDYLQLLSSNKRSQIRRSIKEYQKDGEIHIEMAQSSAQALEMLDALVELHQQEWQKRGKSGVFANPYLYQFHRDLISSRFDAGEIQLLKVHTPNAVIGYLYNFIYQGKVLFYQSGLNYLPGNLYRPGLVSHYYAILFNASRDMRIYDFLAGDDGYKSSLGTDFESVYWVRLIRGRLRFSIGVGIQHLKERISLMPSLSNGLKRIRNQFSSLSGGDATE